MAETFTAQSDAIERALRAEGYSADRSMAEYVASWWAWYTAEHAWYNAERTVLGHRFKVRRRSIHPARFVCREWASAILDDDGTTLTVTSLTEAEPDGEDARGVSAVEDADGWLQDWAARNRFVSKAQMALERAFALGTSAIALWFERDADGVSVRPRRYDARMILPLTWDDDEIVECAFVTEAQLNGKRVKQLQMHVLEEGAYHIKTRIFDARDGAEIADEAILDDFDAGTDRPTFCILRPALDNVYSDGTAMGQSVFADAVDAIRGVDNAWDSLQDEIDSTKVKIFMSDELIDVTDDNGRPLPIPMSPDAAIIHKVNGNGVQEWLETFQPEIRVDKLNVALNVALAELGALCGFGPNYLRFDKDGGLKTAKEVSSDNSTFARNLRKHENEIEPALEGLLGCLVDCALGTSGAQVAVRFDDSIISDTDTEKNMMMAEIGAGVMAPWEYRARFLGEGEEVARAAIAEIGGSAPETSIDDIGTFE